MTSGGAAPTGRSASASLTPEEAEVAPGYIVGSGPFKRSRDDTYDQVLLVTYSVIVAPGASEFECHQTPLAQS